MTMTRVLSIIVCAALVLGACAAVGPVHPSGRLGSPAILAGIHRRECPGSAGTFDFGDLLSRLTALAQDQGDSERNALLTFARKGQVGGVIAKHVTHNELVTGLFRLGLSKAADRNMGLEQRFANEWPL